MTRTNIDLDDDLVAEVMRRFNLSTKKDAVHLALQRVVGPRSTVDLGDRALGIAWVGDLDEMRSERTTEAS